jgi:Cof subfamily protein (haloacid dehalogenase superfamily)
VRTAPINHPSKIYPPGIDNRKSLYVSDLDGTLLSSSGRLSDFSRENLTRLLENGLNFTVASARAISEIQPVLGDLPFKLPVIAVNGAYLTDYKTGKHLQINAMEKSTAQAIFDIIRKKNLWPFVCTFNGREDRLYYQTLDHPATHWYCQALAALGDKRLRETQNLAGVLNETAISLAVMGDREPVGEIADILAGQFAGQLENFYFENPYSPGYWWLTIHDKKACKSIAIKELMEMTGFKREQLTVFGDHINDIRMLELAGTAIAVENAEKEVKLVADEVIGTNEDNSVVKYILGKLKNGK